MPHQTGCNKYLLRQKLNKSRLEKSKFSTGAELCRCNTLELTRLNCQSNIQNQFHPTQVKTFKCSTASQVDCIFSPLKTRGQRMAQGQLRTENETRFKSEPGNKRNKLLKTGTYLIKVIKHHSWRNMKRGEKDQKKSVYPCMCEYTSCTSVYQQILHVLTNFLRTLTQLHKSHTAPEVNKGLLILILICTDLSARWNSLVWEGIPLKRRKNW